MAPVWVASEEGLFDASDCVKCCDITEEYP